MAMGIHGGANAGLVAGPTIASVPAALVDPLGSLSAGLAPDQFLVPIVATAMSGLGVWSFDLFFDAAVAAPDDAGGLFQYVYQAEFGNGQQSQITSSGLALADMIDDVSGYFDPAVSGDGPLAYLLFRFHAGQVGMDPGIHAVADPAYFVPTPSSISLTLLALSVLVAARSLAQRRRFLARSLSITHPQ